jgi:hypothetical protein
MSSQVLVHIFVEDRAHEAFLLAMLKRVATEEEVEVSPSVLSGRGGHGRAVRELKLYQDLVGKGAAGISHPDLLIAGIDGNCSTFAKAKRAIESATRAPLSNGLVVACPDPHVERWYLADPDSFQTVVGHRPTVGKKKCERDHYKRVLAKAVQQAGHPPTLGGIEFASELVERMNLYRAGRNDRSLKAFLDDLRAKLRTPGCGRTGGSR